MQIFHHGATTGVTGSCHELRSRNGESILIDCGLFQGAETSGLERNEAQQIDFPVAHVRALVVTHVHIDHVGRIPYLLAAGFQGPIYCSQASALLLPLVLEDALKVGFTRDEALIRRFLGEIQRRIRPIKFDQWESVSEQMAIRLSSAGHILGSAYVQCLVSEGDNKTRVVFSGDLGAPHSPLLPAPKSPYGCDVLVIESTYGDRMHEGRKQRRQRLQTATEHAVADDGVVLIPAFSIGRTQELLYELESIIHEQSRKDQRERSTVWSDIEVIVDSPLAARFTDYYRQLKSCWDKEALRRVRSGRHPLSFDQLYTVDSHAEHLQTVDYLKNNPRPAIVIAASGMCAGGRIVNYLKALVGDARTDILFVGYQAAGTPGREIQAYGPKGGYVVLEGVRYDIRARIHTLAGYSAHADQKDLVSFVKRMRKKPQEIRIVHGDLEAKQALKDKLQKMTPAASIFIP